jgi:Flp pilus assembly pilin Flp
MWWQWRLMAANFGARLTHDTRGQDMIEYALMAGTVAVVVAGFLPPQVMPAVSSIFSKLIGLAATVH